MFSLKSKSTGRMYTTDHGWNSDKQVPIKTFLTLEEAKDFVRTTFVGPDGVTPSIDDVEITGELVIEVP